MPAAASSGSRSIAPAPKIMRVGKLKVEMLI
jgi:hypothetical protein